MRKEIWGIAIAAPLLASQVASAATVKPDSFLCEGEFEVSLPAREGWTQDGGELLMKVAQNSVVFAQGQMKMAQAMGDLAQRDEQIQSARFRNSGGAYAARAGAAQADQQAGSEKLAKFQRMVSTCAASGAQPLPAEVLERKAISGLSKVRTTFNGAPADLWIRNKDLLE